METSVIKFKNCLFDLYILEKCQLSDIKHKKIVQKIF